MEIININQISHLMNLNRQLRMLSGYELDQLTFVYGDSIETILEKNNIEI